MELNMLNLQSIFTAFSLIFQNAFASAKNAEDWKKVAMLVPSLTSQNVYPWLADEFGLREWVGDRVIQNIGACDWTIKNKDFEGTVGLSKNAIADDQVGVYQPLVANMGYGAAVHPNKLIFPLLKNGFSQLCFDGQYFFDTDHPVGDASVSNFMGGTGTAWYLMCTSMPVKPIIFQKRQDYNFVRMDSETDEKVFSAKQIRYGVDARVNAGYGLWQMAIGSKQTLNADSYEAAKVAMTGLKKANGDPLGLVPDLLVCPTTLEGAAKKVLVDDRTANGGTNTWKGDAQILSTPWLS